MKSIDKTIEEIERKEHAGQRGTWRKTFCQKYKAAIDLSRKNTYRDFIDKISRQQESVTCELGCDYCCKQYFSISIAEGIVIVDYLYKNRQTLGAFIRNYEKWRQTASEISDTADLIWAHNLNSRVPLESKIEASNFVSKIYNGLSVTCPFLRDSACSIYDARPMSCSSHYSISPPDWCSPQSPDAPHIYQLVPKEDDVYRMADLAGTQLSLYELSLPNMIYGLLTEGQAGVVFKIDKLRIKQNPV